MSGTLDNARTMTQGQADSLKKHFLEWSGGFEPESEYQIIVYADYARDGRINRDEVICVLQNWMADQRIEEDN